MAYSSSKIKSAAVIFGGGVGVRLNSGGTPKQFIKVKGIPIIARTISKFNLCPDIDTIIVVCVKGYHDALQNIINEYKFCKVKEIVKGGNNTQESIYNGLACLYNMKPSQDCVVAIHDAVRPMISEKFLSQAIHETREHGSGIAYIPSFETTAISENGYIQKIIPREKTIILKAPQCFIFNKIWECHQLAIQENKLDFIDSAMLFKHYGNNLHLVLSRTNNIKVTYPEDIYILNALLESEAAENIFGLN